MGCAAALLCVEEQYCTLEGMISPEPVALTSKQLVRRVPLSVSRHFRRDVRTEMIRLALRNISKSVNDRNIPISEIKLIGIKRNGVDRRNRRGNDSESFVSQSCRNSETGAAGKCCRDPNYVDPWPTGNLPTNYTGGFDEQGFPTFLNIAKVRPPKKPVTQPPTKTMPVHEQLQPTNVIPDVIPQRVLPTQVPIVITPAPYVENPYDFTPNGQDPSLPVGQLPNNPCGVRNYVSSSLESFLTRSLLTAGMTFLAIRIVFRISVTRVRRL